MSTFGTPTPGGGTEESKRASGPVNGEASAPMIDENDPRLTSEAVNVDVGKDAYAVRPLPPDRKWRAKLKLEQLENANHEKKDYLPAQTDDGIPYFKASISASICDVDGKFEGFKLSPQFGGTVGTLPRKDSSSQVATVLSKLRKPDGTPWATPQMRLSHKGWIDLLIKALAGEPEVGIESQWEWNCSECGKEAKARSYADGYPVSIRGMQKFPAEQDRTKKAEGQLFSPEMKCQKNAAHGFSRAFPKIARFLSLDELKAAG